MGSIYLDKEDVVAVAQQRFFKVKPKTNRQKWVEKITYYGAGLLATLGVCIAWLSESGDKLPNVSLILFAAAFIMAAAFGVGKYLNDAPLRAARREFVQHWEKTGEIKPRWPILADDEDTKRETPPERTG